MFWSLTPYKNTVYWGPLSHFRYLERCILKLLRWFHLNNCSRPKDVKYFIKRQKSKRKNTILAGKLFFLFATSLIIAWSVDYDPLGDDMMILHTSDLFHILTQNCTAILFYYKNILGTHVSCILYLLTCLLLVIIGLKQTPCV